MAEYEENTNEEKTNEEEEGTSEPSKEWLKIHDEAMKRFDESEDGSDYNREQAEEDIRFSRLADQWDEKIKQVRVDEGRPCLTVNKLPSFIRQVVNDARQNKPGLVVSPVDNEADVATAEVINGLIRSIQRNSNADVAFDTALDHAVSGGFGFFEVNIEYANDHSFDLEAKIDRIMNPLSVFWDVSTTMFDASDWDYCFVVEMMHEDEFALRWPKAGKVSFEGDERSHTSNLWLEGNQVQVAKYWRREPKKVKLIQLSDGQVIRESAVTDEMRLGWMVAGIDIKQERESIEYEVTRYIMSGMEILEEAPWPGSIIPVCPVWGEEVVIDGRRWLRSMIHDAVDPQKMVNFWRSASTELVALSPKAPFLIEEGGIPKGEEDAWDTLNTRAHPYLIYSKGKNLPQRQPFAGVPAGSLQEALNASDDMKAIIGIYDSSLGARSNETSGRAILARQREADVSNYHFVDNLSRAIQYCGRVLVEIIPHVYTARKTLRILGEDDTEKVVQMIMDNRMGESVEGQDGVYDMQMKDQENNPERLYGLDVGKYDVAMSAGPNYASKREETRETLIEIMKQVPGAAELIGDILMKYLDFEGADEVEKRLQQLLVMKGIQIPGVTPPAPPGGMPGMPPGGMPGMPPGGMPGMPPPGMPPPGMPGMPPGPLQQGGPPMPPGMVPPNGQPPIPVPQQQF